LIIGRYAKSKADVALGRVQFVYDLVEGATKTLKPRFSHLVWEQVKQLSALYVKQVEAVGTPPRLQQAPPIATQNVSGTSLGSQSVAGGIGGGAGRQGQVSGRQSRASGAGGRRVSGGSPEGSNGVKRQGTESHEEEDDYVLKVDSRPKKTNGNNTVVKIIEREKKKKSFSGSLQRSLLPHRRHVLGHRLDSFV
ncbi:hypothetical protein HDV00_002127, partial [Rhizophlyctis rosea]